MNIYKKEIDDFELALNAPSMNDLEEQLGEELLAEIADWSYFYFNERVNSTGATRDVASAILHLAKRDFIKILR